MEEGGGQLNDDDRVTFEGGIQKWTKINDIIYGQPLIRSRNSAILIWTEV